MLAQSNDNIQLLFIALYNTKMVLGTSYDYLTKYSAEMSLLRHLLSGLYIKQPCRHNDKAGVSNVLYSKTQNARL